MTSTRQQRQSGFTMIELLVVLVILGMLAGLVGPRLFDKLDSSKAGTVQTQVKMLKGALQTYRLDIGDYPSTEDGLEALVRQPRSGRAARRWKGPYLDDEVPRDPWENPFVYERKPSGLQEFSLYSLGADGEPGGDDLDADIGYTPDA
ncbi:MAG: type II secretion system major pseudopilin GspG [Pseudomonadota bacterium]